MDENNNNEPMEINELSVPSKSTLEPESVTTLSSLEKSTSTTTLCCTEVANSPQNMEVESVRTTNPAALYKGKYITHTWDEGNNTLTTYHGKVLQYLSSRKIFRVNIHV